MKRVLRYLVVLLGFFNSNIINAEATSTWYQQEGENLSIKVSLFLSSSCPHCHKAEAFFKDIQTKIPWIKVSYNFIDKDKNALILFNKLLNQLNLQDFAVPSIFFCNSRWIGFSSPETTGDNLLHALNYCKQQILKQNTLSGVTTSVLRHWAHANLFDSNMIENPTPLKYISWIALIDFISPCSLFSLIAFLTLLFTQKKTRDQLTKGLIFIFCLALVHVFQQAQAELFYQILFWLRVPAVIVGGFLIYMSILLYKRKTFVFLSYVLACVLGIFILAYQQTCIMNWSYVFQQWLSNQAFSASLKVWYQLLYQSIYSLPLIFILMIYLGLMKWKESTSLKDKLNQISIMYLLSLGGLLIINPGLLACGLCSVVVLLVGGLLGVVLNKYYNKKHKLNPK